MSDYSSLPSDEDLESAKPKLRLRQASRWDEPVLDDAPVAIEAPPKAPEPDEKSIDAADLMREASNGQATYIELHYTSDAWDCFGVWLTNRLIVVLSAGLLFPWAVARSKAFFYRSVQLDGDAFEFKTNATKACLLNALIYLFAAAGIGLAIARPVEHALWWAGSSAAIAAFLAPFLAHEIIKSNTEALSYRGVPLGFTGDLLSAFKNYLFIPLAAIGVLGYIAFSTSRFASVASIFFWLSVLAYSHRSYKIQNLKFGTRRLKFAGSFKEFQRVYKVPLWFWAGFHAALAGIVYGLIHFEVLTLADLQLLAGNDTQAGLEGHFLLLGLAIAALLGELAWTWWSQIYIKIRTNTYYLERIELERTTILDAYTARGYFFLRLTNLLLKLASLGWLTPWAIVREHRYLISNLAVIAHPATINRICRVASGVKPNEINTGAN